MDYKRLGVRIKETRNKKGFTQAKLAEMLGYSIQHISHVETGSTKLSVELLVELANVLEVSVDELLMDSLEYKKGSSHLITIEVYSNKEEQLISNVVRELQKGLKNF